MALWAGPDRPGFPPAATRREPGYKVLPEPLTGFRFGYKAALQLVLVWMPVGVVVVSLISLALDAMGGR